MLSSRLQLQIISLGEIVSPDISKTLLAFKNLIAEKKPSASPNEISKSIGRVLHENMELINHFKIGKLNEIQFTTKMITALKNATGVELAVAEFNDAWNAMNKTFEQFEGLLKEAIEYNKLPKKQIIFISFTNPKDLRHLEGELKKGGISYSTREGYLVEIGGIQLMTTCLAQKTKAELIESTIRGLNTRLPADSLLAKSMGNLFSLECKDFELIDTKYIRRTNRVDDPILKEDLDRTNLAVESTAAKFAVDTILWNPNEKTLTEALLNTEMVSRQIAVAAL